MAARKKVNDTTEKVQTAEQRFSKEQIVSSAKYVNRSDLAEALLDDKEEYTLSQVDDLMKEFMKGKVK